MDMNELRKPYWEIMERNSFFFQKLSGVRDVFVLGHSCTEVDVPYFSKVKDSVDSEAIQHFSPYGEEDRLRIINLMKMINIDHLHFMRRSLKRLLSNYCCPLKVSEQRDIHPQCCCNGIADDFSEGKPLSRREAVLLEADLDPILLLRAVLPSLFQGPRGRYRG